VVALVLYGPSASHTAGVFDKLTPDWGFIALVGVEFGLLYAAFRRRLAKSEKEPLPWTLCALERRTTTDTREQAWQEVEFTVFYRALFVDGYLVGEL
jgi:hypothetical protein